MGLLGGLRQVQLACVRQYGVNVFRRKKGLAPRFAYSPLSETAEFSYLDGRGQAPLNRQQKKRYERDQQFAQTIVQHLKQFQLARQLRQEQVARQPELPPTPQVDAA